MPVFSVFEPNIFIRKIAPQLMCLWPGGLSAMKPTVKGNSGMGTGKYCWGRGRGGEWVRHYLLTYKVRYEFALHIYVFFPIMGRNYYAA